MRGPRLVPVLVLIVVLGFGLARAHADTAPAVALLPLDADKKLEIYGQPVAKEIARELVAGGVDVVVVAPNEHVPERARLIVDGTITAGKGTAVVLAIRIRERATGATLDKLEATAPALTSIDRAASDLAARVLPSVRTGLAAAPVVTPPDAKHTPIEAPPSPPQQQPLLSFEVAADPRRTTQLEHGLPDALAEWATRHHWRSASGPGGDARVVVHVLSYEVTPGTVQLARARVRVQLGHFDRVVVTDTVVGDRGLAADQLALRTARAVCDILEPHMRRAYAAWK